MFPNLAQKCSQHFYYRDFIECGETFSQTRVQNTPKALETWKAIEELAVHILDPTVNHFGSLELTYGFAGQLLLSRLRQAKTARIVPKLDQHSSHELNTKGHRICKRDGIACDFFVKGTSSKIVAAWIIDNCPFDRLYYYGANRPLHVSHCIAPQGKVCVMLYNNDRLMPRTIRRESFLEYVD